MALPSTIQGSNSVTQPKKLGVLTEEWPSLPGTCSPEIMHERMVVFMPDSVPRVQNSEFKKNMQPRWYFDRVSKFKDRPKGK
jgi:hypothetical protein